MAGLKRKHRQLKIKVLNGINEPMVVDLNLFLKSAANIKTEKA
jgi:hypothetical protein